jgi:carbon-monoxide dehydrogenase medium subunit
VRVAVTGAKACAFRVTAFEQALGKNWSPKALDGVKVSTDGVNSDLHASAAYRAHLIGVLARRAVEQSNG